MNKTMYVIAAALILSAGFVAAHGLVEDSGSYDELAEAKEEYGPVGPWWVDSEEDFVQWRERHEAMEELHARYGMMGYGRGGCHGW